MDIFQNNIDKILKAQGRSQAWLADQIGKGRSMVNYYCKNHKQPTLDTANLIADTLNVTLNDLVKEKETE